MKTNPPDQQKDQAQVEAQVETPEVSSEEVSNQDASPEDTTGESRVETVDLSNLEEKLQQALEDKKAIEDQYLRLRAEFDNFRRRTRQEASELRQRAAEDLVSSLLAVVDNLERATQATEEGQGVPQSFIDGVHMIYKQLLSELGKAGLQKIEALGTPFDPNIHEAVIHEETDEHPDGHVMEELRTGYIFGGKVLRPSMVKVAKSS